MQGQIQATFRDGGQLDLEAYKYKQKNFISNNLDEHNVLMIHGTLM